MLFRKKDTGIVYDVTNPSLLAQYEQDTRFEKVEEEKPKKKKKKAE